MKRYFFVSIILGTILVILGCSGSKSASNRLVFAINSNPTSFDPRLAVSAYSQHINGLIFNGLVKFNDTFDLVPDLAEKYEIEGDKVYLFHLKRGILFHNGKELTSDDVIYTFNSIIDGSTASPLKTAFEPIKEIIKIDEYSLKIVLKEVNAPFITNLVKGIIPKDYASSVGEGFGIKPIGTGPYKLARFDTDSSVLLERNDSYFEKKPKMQFVEFKILKDENVRVLQLMKGYVDILQNEISPAIIETLKNRDDISVDSRPSIIFDYLGMNLEDKILSDVRVRKALAYAIDRDEIIKHKWEGYAKKAYSIMYPEHWAFYSDVDKYEFDLEKAKTLLDEAGFIDPEGDAPRFKLTYKTSVQSLSIDIASLIANQLKKIGIDVNIESYEWGTFFRDITNGNFQLYSLSWVGVTEPDIYYNVFNSSQFAPNGANRNKYKNELMDKLTQEGRGVLDREKRKGIYSEIQKIAGLELPYIPLWYEDIVIAKRVNVKGYKVMPNSGFLGVVDAWKE